MREENTRSVVILKNLPSNLIEEAIMVVKDKRKLNNSKMIKALEDEKFSLFNKEKEQNSIIQGSLKEEEFKKLEKINKEERKYVIKEAEMVLSNYLMKLDNEKKDKRVDKLERKYKRMKKINIGLIIFSAIACYIGIFGY